MQDVNTQNDMQQLEEAVLAEIHEIAKEQALHAQPECNLAAALAMHTVTFLRDLARIYRIKGFSRMNKAALVEEIVPVLSRPEILQIALSATEKLDWQVFLQAVQQETAVCTARELVLCKSLVDVGVLQVYFHENTFYTVATNEIKAAFAALEKDGIVQDKYRKIEIIEHFEAAMELYGTISVSDFIALYNAYQHVDLSEADVHDVLSDDMLDESGIALHEGYYVQKMMNENNFAEFKALVARISDKPRYIPAHAEFLRYAEGDYYEETAQTKAIADFLSTLLPGNPEVVEEVTEELCFGCAVEMAPDALMQIVENYDVPLDGIAQIEGLFAVLIDLCNHTRIWSNCGHTPAEINALSANMAQKGLRTEKVGRNEPCPCGSGKKYKKCCGR